MSLTFQMVNAFIKKSTRVICRVDDSQLRTIPHQGPLILVCNHINSLEVPLMFTHLQPRPVTGFAKAESWDNPALGWLFDLWGGIPLHRGEADMKALRQGLHALDKGKILTITPEGTRTGNGTLSQGYPGMVLLALYSDVPLLPLVYYGHENFRHDLKRLRRSTFNIMVGKPFKLFHPKGTINAEVRQQITDEIMYQLAFLLPESYRGGYSDFSKATTRYLNFDLS